jgi:hypothetical protein
LKDVRLVLETRLSDAQLVANSCRDQLEKETRQREELRRLIEHAGGDLLHQMHSNSGDVSGMNLSTSQPMEGQEQI